MMRGLVIATNGDMRVQTFTAPALEDVQKVVGGYVETGPVRNIEGHYLLMVDEDARLQWPRPVVNEVASFLACTKIFGTVVLTSAYGPELGLPDDIAEDDYVIFHGAGAYSVVTNTRFNGFGAMTRATVMGFD